MKISDDQLREVGEQVRRAWPIRCGDDEARLILGRAAVAAVAPLILSEPDVHECSAVGLSTAFGYPATRKLFANRLASLKPDPAVEAVAGMLCALDHADQYSYPIEAAKIVAGPRLVYSDHSADADQYLDAMWAGPIAWVESATAIPSPDEERFERLAEEWEDATAMHSVMSKIITHRAHLRIIAMGEVALPLILRRMKKKPGHWFWALDALTNGESPAEGAENLQQATEAWINWGETKGYLEG